tara:strand:+ start:1032 stop:1820 length:789 start_codon:yes stop_codon:yes gene_type:complete
MKLLKAIFFTLFISIVFITCEKEIDLDLKESPELFVIEGIVHDNLGDNLVALSKTRTYDNNGAIEIVSGASVKITDNLGTVYSLYEITPGVYTDSTLLGVSGRSYNLDVNINGNIISASSVMSPRIEIDSLTYDEIPNFGGDDELEYSILCHFTDPLNVINFYRMKSFLGDDQLDGYVNWNDDAIDGTSTGLPVFNVTYLAGEYATIQLLSVDEPNFRYFVGLALSQEGEVPGNPESNLIGENAVGYFGAYAKSEVTIIIGE